MPYLDQRICEVGDSPTVNDENIGTRLDDTSTQHLAERGDIAQLESCWWKHCPPAAKRRDRKAFAPSMAEAEATTEATSPQQVLGQLEMVSAMASAASYYF